MKRWIDRLSDEQRRAVETLGVIAEYTLATHAANLDRTRIDPDYRSG